MCPEGEIMGTRLNKDAFAKLIQEDIEWLEPLVGHSLEGKHILDVLRWSVDALYPVKRSDYPIELDGQLQAELRRSDLD